MVLNIVTIHILYIENIKSFIQNSSCRLHKYPQWIHGPVSCSRLYIEYFFLHIRFIFHFGLKICTPQSSTHYNIWILYFWVYLHLFDQLSYYWNFWYRELCCILYWLHTGKFIKNILCRVEMWKIDLFCSWFSNNFLRTISPLIMKNQSSI